MCRRPALGELHALMLQNRPCKHGSGADVSSGRTEGWRPPTRVPYPGPGSTGLGLPRSRQRAETRHGHVCAAPPPRVSAPVPAHSTAAGFLEGVASPSMTVTCGGGRETAGAAASGWGWGAVGELSSCSVGVVADRAVSLTDGSSPRRTLPTWRGVTPPGTQSRQLAFPAPTTVPPPHAPAPCGPPPPLRPPTPRSPHPPHPPTPRPTGHPAPRSPRPPPPNASGAPHPTPHGDPHPTLPAHPAPHVPGPPPHAPAPPTPPPPPLRGCWRCVPPARREGFRPAFCGSSSILGTVARGPGSRPRLGV